MTLPDFLIIGGKKCGTTPLFRLLCQHPDLCLPQKEVHFFTYEGQPPPLPHVVTDLASYHALFAECAAPSRRGEASPSYLHVPRAAERIRRQLPDVKLIALLRHPVDRLYSDFLHERRSGRESNADLRTALAQDEVRCRFNYREKSRYGVHLSRYFDLFPSGQIRVCLHDDLVDDTVQFVQDLFAFLEVDDRFVPDTDPARASGVPRSRLVHTLTSTSNPVKALARTMLPSSVYVRLGHWVDGRNAARPTMDPALRQELLEEYRPDVEWVSSLLGRDLSAWMS